MRPTSIRRSTASSKAASAASGSSTSRPASRAKWLRVPQGTQTKGRSRSIATAATTPSEPSPPATPRASASASRASSARSSPCRRTCTRTPSFPAASQSSSSPGRPLPECGLTRRKPDTSDAAVASLDEAEERVADESGREHEQQNGSIARLDERPQGTVEAYRLLRVVLVRRLQEERTDQGEDDEASKQPERADARKPSPLRLLHLACRPLLLELLRERAVGIEEAGGDEGHAGECDDPATRRPFEHPRCHFPLLHNLLAALVPAVEQLHCDERQHSIDGRAPEVTCTLREPFHPVALVCAVEDRLDETPERVASESKRERGDQKHAVALAGHDCECALAARRRAQVRQRDRARQDAYQAERDALCDDADTRDVPEPRAMGRAPRDVPSTLDGIIDTCRPHAAVIPRPRPWRTSGFSPAPEDQASDREAESERAER